MKPRLLDLFSGQGGAAEGYHRAGFEVIGVDIKPQSKYPFEFHQADAIEYLLEHGHEYDAIHASPPCQAFSRCAEQKYRDNHQMLICATRIALNFVGKPWVIENVEDAKKWMRNPLMLCGSMFGLPIHRHRRFETNPELGYPLLPPCGVNGKAIYITGTPRPLDGSPRVDPPAATKRAAMDTPWMSTAGMDEAIPPAYTEFIGRQLLIACRKVSQ